MGKTKVCVKGPSVKMLRKRTGPTKRVFSLKPERRSGLDGKRG